MYLFSISLGHINEAYHWLKLPQSIRLHAAYSGIVYHNERGVGPKFVQNHAKFVKKTQQGAANAAPC